MPNTLCDQCPSYVTVKSWFKGAKLSIVDVDFVIKYLLEKQFFDITK